MSDLPNLQPGDTLLYAPSSIYGSLISIKTWHKISHVEGYLGNGVSSASRDGKGVNLYPVRTDHLAVVMRLKPEFSFDTTAATAYTNLWAGTPYGWLELLHFVGITPWQQRGIVCSPWWTQVLRQQGIPVFNDDPRDLIAPFQFLTCELMTKVWAAKGY